MKFSPLRIEDYGLIGDTQSAALVGRNGSIDWLCLPYFSSAACFSALLGDASHGRWAIAPADASAKTTRRYRGHSLVLETEFTAADGVVRLIDCMPPRQNEPDVVRIVEGVSGEVAMQMELVIRFDYGSIVPWARTIDGVLRTIGGPDALSLWSPVPTHGEDLTTCAEFRVKAGQRLPFLLVWHPSHVSPPRPIDALRAVEETEQWWEEWCRHCTYAGEWREQVLRSLITLKALTFQPTGGIVAAPTTSLPEHIGGVRNWDYRYCWLRDATFTLLALLVSGFTGEAVAWRDWLLRAVAGDPADLQIMYGLFGERRLVEMELPLPGYEGSTPVRIGNAAAVQRQLDVFGEVMDALHVARREGVEGDADSWALQTHLMTFLAEVWNQPDEGIWEVRGPRRHFTHSKIMAWVAVDRAIRSVERFGVQGPVDQWRTLRAQIQEDIFRNGFDRARGTFTQSYGSRELDASLLTAPMVGFLEATDPRMVGTVTAIERELMRDGLLLRYPSEEPSTEKIDGLPPGEGAFLPCTFWLADNYALQGRGDEARRIFERLLALTNDLGLLSEEYDPRGRRQLGNFPQAFSHVALVNTAFNLSAARGPAESRRST